MRRRVVVIGAGPAGVAVAMRLWRRGVKDLVVLERYPIGRDKPCGGGLTGHAEEAMRDLGLALRVPSVASGHAVVRFGGYRREVALERPVRIVRRAELDADLVAQARAAGIEVEDNVAVSDLEIDEHGVRVRCEDGRVVGAEVVVGADGVASVVRRRLAGPPDLPHRLFMCEVPGALAGNEMVYDFSPMSRGVRGYAWLFPLTGGKLNVGIMHYPVDRRGGPELLGVLRDVLAEYGVTLPVRGARGWPVWGYHPKTPIGGRRALCVGDAAGIDGLTGEGIAVAMEQAIVAGDLIAERLASPSPATRGRLGDGVDLSDFAARLRRTVVGRELDLDRHLARLLYQRGEGWRRWLSLVLHDPDVLELYAARVSGSQVLADQKLRLGRALVRHLLVAPARRRALAAAESRTTPPGR